MGCRNCGIRRSRGKKSEVKAEVKVKVEVKVEEKNSTIIWNLFREKMK
jgi:hypothetical protein